MSVSLLNRAVSACSDPVLRPWSDNPASFAASPWPTLILGSCLIAVIMVLLFALTSDQQLLKRRRNRLLARTLELLLFRHDARVSITACARILKANAAYLWTFAMPTLIAVIPITLMIVQLAAWFEYRPLISGETALLEIAFDKSIDVAAVPVTIMLSDSLELDGAPVRIPSENEICWRLQVKSEQESWIEVRSGEFVERKECAVGQHLIKVSTKRTRSDLVQEILHPVERPLPAEGPFEQILIRFPPRTLHIADKEVHWLVAAIVIMMIAGLVTGKLFGVSIT